MACFRVADGGDRLQIKVDSCECIPLAVEDSR
jgi:hypothetical protein